MMIFKQIVFLAVIVAFFMFILNGGALDANDDERAVIKKQDRHPAYTEASK